MSVEVEVLQPEIVNEQIDAVITKSGIAEDSALTLRGQFSDYYENIITLREKASMVTEPEDPTNQKIAREVRLGLRKVRCEVENVRKTLKADSLARGKAIDGFANVLKYLCEPIEEKLLDIEKYAERQEEARIAELVTDRQQAIIACDGDPDAYNLAAMDDATFEATLEMVRRIRDDRIEANRQAEADRIAREQADRIAREKAEADAVKARAEAEKERKAREAAEAKARKEKEAAAAKAAAAQAKAEAALQKERDFRKSLEVKAAEAKAQADAKAKAEAAANRKAASAPDKQKIIMLAGTVRNLNGTLPEMRTEEGETVLTDISAKIERFADWIMIRAEEL